MLVLMHQATTSGLLINLISLLGKTLDSSKLLKELLTIVLVRKKQSVPFWHYHDHIRSFGKPNQNQ